MTINNIVLITGSTGGLGQPLVDSFLEAGYFVFAGVKDIHPMDSVIKKHERLRYIELDITDNLAIDKCIQEIGKIGVLKVLVNNAGVSGWGSFWKRDISVEKNIFDVNLWGTILLVKSFWDILEKNNGIIINMGSISGTVPTPFISAYSAAKSALEKLMLAIFLEKRKTSIRVLHLNLGPLDRGMCGNTIEKEEMIYNEKIRQHMIKIQKIHGYDVEKVCKYIHKFLKGNTQYKMKTLGIWSNIIVFFSHFISQPRYQKFIGKLYKSI